MTTCRTNFKNFYDVSIFSKKKLCEPTGLSFRDAKLQQHLRVSSYVPFYHVFPQSLFSRHIYVT